MVKEVLVEAAIDAGAKLLSKLDHANFPVDSMFWVQLPEVSRWRLVIASPLVRDQGQRVAYERVGGLLREADSGLSLTEVSVFAPDLVELASLLSVVETSGQVVAGPSWVAFGEGIVYRWTGDAIVGNLSCDVDQAKLFQIWELERRLARGPKLLFSLDGRELTIRFHPQHGRLRGLEDIKKEFQIALYRYQECQVDWL